jgi:hypothetical protein
MRDYEETCKRAATSQGLDPLTERVAARKGELDAVGAEYDVEQTGGFTMVATFYTATEAITCTFESCEPDCWYVCAQPKENWTEGEYNEDETTDLSGFHVTPDLIIDTVIERAQGHYEAELADKCRYCGAEIRPSKGGVCDACFAKEQEK